MSAGRPREIDDELVARMFKSGVSVAKIAAWLGKTRNAVYIAIRRSNGVQVSPAARVKELAEALEELRLPNGHFHKSCVEGNCHFRCRKAQAALKGGE